MEVDYASEANNTESKLEDGELKFHLTLLVKVENSICHLPR